MFGSQCVVTVLGPFFPTPITFAQLTRSLEKFLFWKADDERAPWRPVRRPYRFE